MFMIHDLSLRIMQLDPLLDIPCHREIFPARGFHDFLPWNKSRPHAIPKMLWKRKPMGFASPEGRRNFLAAFRPMTHVAHFASLKSLHLQRETL